MPRNPCAGRCPSPPPADVSRGSRRVLLGGALAVGAVGAAALVSAPRAEAQVSDLTLVQGDCSGEPGVQLYVGFSLGYPVVSLSELAVPANWVPNPTARAGIAFRQPPDWWGGTLYAYEFSPRGMPNWTTQWQIMQPYLYSARAQAPGGVAGYEKVDGTGYVLLGPLDVANIAEMGVVGEQARRQTLCTYLFTTGNGPGWMQTTLVDDDTLLLTVGVATAYPNQTVPSTVVVWEAMWGPRDQFETLMRAVFFPIMAQFFVGRDFMYTPTPTPEP